MEQVPAGPAQLCLGRDFPAVRVKEPPGRRRGRERDLKKKEALTWVARLVGHCPTKQKFTSSIPSQGTHLGCGFGTWLGH